MRSFSVEEINKILDGSLCGTTTHQITGPEQIEYAGPQHITFIGDKKYIKLWKNSKASVAIVNEDFNIDPIENKAIIKVKNADVAMVKVLELFTPELPAFDLDIHPTAVIHPTASVGKNTQIGAGCYIGMHVVLGDHVTLYPNTTILDHSTVGHHTLIWSGTVIRERCHIGNHCILQPNVTIGADGFGYYPDTNKPGLLKIPQIGNVIIGDHVEIGSSSCIDRGKFSATVIGDGTKIDNLVQIGHNTKIGRFCIIAGTTGIAGSVLVEDGVIIAGGVSIKDHTTIGSKAIIGACSSVLLGDVEPGKTMLGYPAMEARNTLKQWSFLKNTVK